MSEMKTNAKSHLRVTFVMQVVLSVFLFACALYIHLGVTHLADQQPATRASEDRARSRIQNGRDIEELRAAAIHALNSSDISWDTVVQLNRYTDMALWGLTLYTAMLATLGGYAVYANRYKNPAA